MHFHTAGMRWCLPCPACLITLAWQFHDGLNVVWNSPNAISHCRDAVVSALPRLPPPCMLTLAWDAGLLGLEWAADGALHCLSDWVRHSASRAISWS